MRRGRERFRRILGRPCAVLLIVVAWAVSLDAQVFDAVPPVLRDYTGPSVVAHENQVFNLFVPQSPVPPEGHPVVLMFEAGGYLEASVPPSITPVMGFLHDALTSGVAVVWASSTPSRGGQTGNPVDGVPGDGLGPAYKGNGVFVPPDYVMPANYTGGPLHPIHDVERPMPEKDLVMLVQHVKEHAAALGIDASRIALHGRSAGAITAWFVAAGPDRSDIWLTPSGQELRDTSVSAVVLRGGATYWPVMSQLAPPKGFHFPVDPGGAGGLFDEPATNLGEVAPELLAAASSLVYALDEGATPGITLDVHRRAIHMTFGGATLDETDVSGPPYLQDHYTNIHTAWSGFAMKEKFCNARFVISAQDAAAGMPVTYDASYDGDPDGLDADMLTWLLDVWDRGGVDDPWSYEGVGSPGTDGLVPVLRGCGPFVAGSDNSLELRAARADAVSTLVVGVAELGAPFKGGVLVPVPNLLVTLPVGPDGTWRFGFALPSDTLPGLEIVLQAWVADGDGAGGFASSNAVAVTVS